MKKIIAALIVFSSYSAISQTTQGKFLLGPTINYRQSNSENEPVNLPTTSNQSKYSQLNASVRVGYFVADNVAVGVIGGFSNVVQSDKNNNINFQGTNTTKTNLGTFGLFARAYKLFNEKRFGVFGELSGTYGIGSSETVGKYTSGPNTATTENRSSAKIGSLNAGIRPGFVFFINDKIGFEASVGEIHFQSTKTDNSSAGQKISTTRSSNLNLAFGWDYINLGFHFYLGKKKE